MISRLFGRLHRWWERTIESRASTKLQAVAWPPLVLIALILKSWALRYKPGDPKFASFSRASQLVGSVSPGIMWTAFVVTLTLWVRAMIMRNVTHTGRVDPERLLNLPPEPDRWSPYCFRLVKRLPELEPFVSESEHFLFDLNSDLTTAKRWALYERWFEINPDSFMYLSHVGRAKPIALSIILPLTKKGYESLYGIERPQKKVILFGEEEICKDGPYSRVLIDTFIVSQRSERYSNHTRGYGRALILRHLGVFWKNKKNGAGLVPLRSNSFNPSAFKVVAETEKKPLIGDMVKLGFQLKGESGIDAALYEFSYPPLDVNDDEFALVQRVVGNIWELKKWRW